MPPWKIADKGGWRCILPWRFVSCRSLTVTMSRRFDWVKLTSALKPHHHPRQSLSHSLYTIHSTRKRGLTGSGTPANPSSSWTTSRVLLLSVFTCSLTYLYGTFGSQSLVDSLHIGNRVPKYASTRDFTKVCYDYELLNSFRSLTASCCRRSRNCARLYPRTLSALMMRIYELMASLSGLPSLSRSFHGLLPIRDRRKKSHK